MITTKDILELGLEHVGTTLNGGSKLFRISKTFALVSNADNTLIDESKRNEIIIKRVTPDLNWDILYTGTPDIYELEKVLEKIKDL